MFLITETQEIIIKRCSQGNDCPYFQNKLDRKSFSINKNLVVVFVVFKIFPVGMGSRGKKAPWLSGF